MSWTLASIVEGHGEQLAVGTLLRRIIHELNPALDFQIAKPIRASRYKLVRAEELERSIALAIRLSVPPCGVLVILDADDDCPAKLAPVLSARIERAFSHIPCGVVLANREYESWFLASRESLQGQGRLKTQLEPILEPETIRDAKKVVTSWMSDGLPYSPTADQGKLTALMDLALTRQNSRSFDKLWREVERLISQFQTPT